MIDDLNRTQNSDKTERKSVYFHFDPITIVNEVKTLVDTVIETKRETTDIDVAINKILADKSTEAKLGRLRVKYRAIYAEFMCSLMYYSAVYCTMVNGYINNVSNDDTRFRVAFVAGFMRITLSYAFSSISGALFNPAISFALWITGKLTTSRCFYYICAQLIASIVAMSIVTCIFSGNMQDIYEYLRVHPGHNPNLGKIFITEFFFTFILIYIVFTVVFEQAETLKKENMSIKTISDSKGLTLYASTPQSKFGFAPFSFGFVIFSLSLMGGTGGGSFNPARFFGPAVFTGNFDYMWLYWLGEIIGSGVAALLVDNLYKIGLDGNTDLDCEDTPSAAEVIKEVVKSVPSLVINEEPLSDTERERLTLIDDNNLITNILRRRSSIAVTH